MAARNQDSRVKPDQRQRRVARGDDETRSGARTRNEEQPAARGQHDVSGHWSAVRGQRSSGQGQMTNRVGHRIRRLLTPDRLLRSPAPAPISSSSRTTSATVLPSTSASGRMIRRWPSTPEGDGLHVLVREIVPAVEQGAGAAQRSRHSDARGLAPRATSGCFRLASARSTMYSQQLLLAVNLRQAGPACPGSARA